ncbi:MAG: DUF502 domain-containing protein [Chlamydiae bacterium]|nr:DUF502 domain-containing protein [Chlamydiota bacterium]
MKKHLVTGLVILLPITLTVMIVVFLMDLLTAPFLGLVHAVLSFLGTNIAFLHRHQDILLLISRLIVLTLVVLAIFLLGYLANKLFFKFFFSLFHRLMLKIPLVKKVYQILRDITKTFFPQKGKVFQASVLVNFPCQDSYMMGFQTNDAPKMIKDKVPSLKDAKAVFLPTALHPSSGFLLILNPQKIHELDLKTEDVFKTLISVGLFTPEDSSKP